MQRVRYEKLEQTVANWVRNANLQRAISHCEKQLAALSRTEFHQALGRDFLAQTEEAARWLGDFCSLAAKSLSVQALYCEMVCLETTPDVWYLNALAYDLFDPDSFDWLVGWKRASGSRGRFVLTGISDIQMIFARYRGDETPKLRTASEVAALLMNLRMLELILAASKRARKSGNLPEEVPVLAGVHDSDLICCCYGRVKPPVKRFVPKRPVVPPPPKQGRLGVYEMDGGYDEMRNSLPWDVLDYACQSDWDRCRNLLDRAKPLATTWRPPRVKLRQRDWRCDLISLYPHRAVNEKARTVLMPLLGKNVEFLPLRCADLPALWVLHPLRRIDLSAGAIHNGEPGRNMTAISKYEFAIEDLHGNHFFAIKQAPASPSRKAGFCFGFKTFVSEEFRRLVASHGLQGVVFKKVFSYRG